LLKIQARIQCQLARELHARLKQLALHDEIDSSLKAITSKNTVFAFMQPKNASDDTKKKIEIAAAKMIKLKYLIYFNSSVTHYQVNTRMGIALNEMIGKYLTLLSKFYKFYVEFAHSKGRTFLAGMDFKDLDPLKLLNMPLNTLLPTMFSTPNTIKSKVELTRETKLKIISSR
jgi:hypothetical protein